MLVNERAGQHPLYYSLLHSFFHSKILSCATSCILNFFFRL